MKQITITSNTNTHALLVAIAAIVFLIARRLVRLANAWLNTKHNFGDNEDDLILTGWQYLGVGVLTCLICLLLSIDWGM